MSEPKVNIYQMYMANGNRTGFYVKRNSWSWQIAEVLTVDGKTSGELTGVAPYFNNPKVIGKLLNSDETFEITSAGTYGYTLIERNK